MKTGREERRNELERRCKERGGGAEKEGEKVRWRRRRERKGAERGLTLA